MNNACNNLKSWMYKELVVPLREMTYTEKIVCIFIGLWFGIFPIPGVSTPLLLFGILSINRFVLHAITISETTVATALNLLSTPLCIALMPVWMQWGSYVFNVQLTCSASEIINGLSLATLPKFGLCLFMGSALWIAQTTILLPIALYVRWHVKSQQAQETSGNQERSNDVELGAPSHDTQPLLDKPAMSLSHARNTSSFSGLGNGNSQSIGAYDSMADASAAGGSDKDDAALQFTNLFITDGADGADGADRRMMGEGGTTDTDIRNTAVHAGVIVGVGVNPRRNSRSRLSPE